MNPETEMTLDDAVAETLALCTGLDLEYEPETDRYRAITRALNRALRAIALEVEWSYYASTMDVGTVTAGTETVDLPATARARIIGDDAVRFVTDDGQCLLWAYFMVRDAVNKYSYQKGLWVQQTRSTLYFSRPFTEVEDGLHCLVPVMREPEMFRLLPRPEDPEDPVPDELDSTRQQLVDFPYPDVIVARAAYMYAQTDPVMQPRVQTLEGGWKDLMYQLKERDEANTDVPFLNGFEIPMEGGFNQHQPGHGHPHA